VIARVVRQQALELDARAQQLQGNANVDLGPLVMVAVGFALDQDAQIFRRTEGARGRQIGRASCRERV